MYREAGQRWWVASLPLERCQSRPAEPTIPLHTSGVRGAVCEPYCSFLFSHVGAMDSSLSVPISRRKSLATRLRAAGSPKPGGDYAPATRLFARAVQPETSTRPKLDAPCSSQIGRAHV